MCKPFTDIETHWVWLYLMGHTTWGHHAESFWCAWLFECHMNICPNVWKASSQMCQILPDGTVVPVRLHCERDPPEEHTCLYCCAVQNFLAVLGQANASANRGSGCSSTSRKSFARSWECCSCEYVLIIWLLERPIWREARRPSHTLNRWRCSCSHIMEIFMHFV